MSEPRQRKDELEISPRIKRIIGFNRYLTREILLKLNSNDVEELLRIASGDIPKVSRGERIKSMSALTSIGESKACKILSEIIANDKEDIDLRAAAALNLSLLPIENAEDELITNLKVEEDLVREKIIKSLGRVGGERALKALDEISDIKTEFVAKQLEFAKALISYRLGLEREDIPFKEGIKREPTEKDELIKLTIKQLGKKKIKKNLQLFKGSSYGIDLADNLGFEVRARKAKWMLFLNKKCTVDNFVSNIIKQKILTGLLTRWIEETNRYVVQYIILTHPHDLLIDIMIIRTDGEIFYSGRGNIKNGKMLFSITDIEHSGTAPTYVKGELTPKGVEFEISIPFGRRRNKRQAENLDLSQYTSKSQN